VFHLSVWGAWSFVWGAKLPKAPPLKRECIQLCPDSTYSVEFVLLATRWT